MNSVVFIVRAQLGKHELDAVWIVEAVKGDFHAKVRVDQLNKGVADYKFQLDKLKETLVKDDDFNKFFRKQDALLKRFRAALEEPNFHEDGETVYSFQEIPLKHQERKRA